MRAALWLMGLFAAAVALALFTGDNDGTVTIFWPPHRVDLSVNLVLLLLVGLFVLLHLALRALTAALELPRQARRWRAQQRERATHTALLDAMTQYAAGRFLRARKAAEGALAREQALVEAGDAPPHATALRTLAHVTAAESAHALQDHATRDTHLDQALKTAARPGTAAELREGVLLRAARWSLNDRDPAGALARLEELPTGAQRRTAALRIKLKAARQHGRIADAMDTARLLAKHRAFSPAASASVVRGLLLASIRDARDTSSLQQFWLSLDEDERAMPEVAIPATERLIELGGEAQQARTWLLPVWEHLLGHPSPRTEAHLPKLVQVLQSCLSKLDGAWLARIEAASNAHPREPRLQYLAGMACVQRELWGKAQQLLTRAAPLLQDPLLRTRAWQRLALMAEHRGDMEASAIAWKLAAQAMVVLPENPAREA